MVLFAVQHFGTDKIGYAFAPVVFVWLLLMAAIGIYNMVKYDIGTLKAFNAKYIIDYFRRNKKKGWVSLGEILLCFTGMRARTHTSHTYIQSVEIKSSTFIYDSIFIYNLFPQNTQKTTLSIFQCRIITKRQNIFKIKNEEE